MHVNVLWNVIGKLANEYYVIVYIHLQAIDDIRKNVASHLKAVVNKYSYILYVKYVMFSFL